MANDPAPQTRSASPAVRRKSPEKLAQGLSRRGRPQGTPKRNRPDRDHLQACRCGAQATKHVVRRASMKAPDA